jgi:GGDEF domain-containing protein
MSPAIEIRDQRGGEGPAAWIGAIGRRLERFRRDGGPFAVLLAELTGLQRLHEQEGAAAAESLAGAVEGMLAAELRGPDGRGAAGEEVSRTITCERPGRYWLLAPDADRTGAHQLAERLTRAAASITTARGHRADLVIGTASCPQDGREAAALAAHADVGLYAARAAARGAAQRSAAAVDRRG